MPTVLVSGCFDPLHVGHIEFFRRASRYGELHVSVATDATIRKLKGPGHPRQSEKERLFAVGSVRYVEYAFHGSGEGILDFEPELRAMRPDVLVVSEDQDYPEKRALAAELGVEYVVLPRIPPLGCDARTSTALTGRDGWVPARVDFAGGWLDVPAIAEATGIEPLVVNMAVSPGYTSSGLGYHPGGGMGGSAAMAILAGKDPFAAEENAGVGWQDPAVLLRTGLCVWRGPKDLAYWDDGEWLRGRLAVLWTGQPHRTADLVSRQRPYDLIRQAAETAAEAVRERDVTKLAAAINMSYRAQIAEGMEQLPHGGLAWKYCGAGHGGYAMYLFGSERARRNWIALSEHAQAIEPFARRCDGEEA